MGLLGACLSAFCQGLFLGPGQSYTQQLSLQDIGPAPAGLLSSLTVNFSPGSFSGGATVRLEAFANSLTDTPIAQTFTVSQSPDPGAFTGLSLLLPTDPPFFGDLQGIARVTMVSGDAQLSGFSVDQVISGERYSESILVPEPSGFGFAFLGMGCLVLLRTRQRAQPSACHGSLPRPRGPAYPGGDGLRLLAHRPGHQASLR